MNDRALNNIVAIVRDLMDRSRLSAESDRDVSFVSTIDAAAVLVANGLASRSGAEMSATVVVDLRLVNPGDWAKVGAIAAAIAPAGRVIGYGPHVDSELLATARQHGVAAVARSRFFANLRQIVAGSDRSQ